MFVYIFGVIYKFHVSFLWNARCLICHPKLINKNSKRFAGLYLKSIAGQKNCNWCGEAVSFNLLTLSYFNRHCYLVNVFCQAWLVKLWKVFL